MIKYIFVREEEKDDIPEGAFIFAVKAALEILVNDSFLPYFSHKRIRDIFSGNIIEISETPIMVHDDQINQSTFVRIEENPNDVPQELENKIRETLEFLQKNEIIILDDHKISHHIRKVSETLYEFYRAE